MAVFSLCDFQKNRIEQQTVMIYQIKTNPRGYTAPALYASIHYFFESDPDVINFPSTKQPKNTVRHAREARRNICGINHVNIIGNGSVFASFFWEIDQTSRTHVARISIIERLYFYHRRGKQDGNTDGGGASRRNAGDGGHCRQ